MIYLIDDKELRQSKDFGWTENKLSEHKDVLTVIHDNVQLQSHRQQMFEKENVIIFHESFFSNPKNKTDKKSDKINQELIDTSEEKDILIFLFSGSNASRSINRKTATTYPSNIYNNLLFFVEQYRENPKNVSAEDLLFGSNRSKEKLLALKKEIWELLYRKDDGFKITPKLHSTISKFNDLNGSLVGLNSTEVEYIKYKINSNEK